MDRKYVFVSGGVVSSLGKGITAASLGRLLKARGYRISMQKLDPYYNVDPGLLSPLQHGETFVTEDGTCADLDLGHYERIVDCNLSGRASVTTGKVHRSIMEKEMRGDYKGATLQVIPHVTNEIIEKIVGAADDADSEIAIVEIGGTVGDMESSPYFEATRQLKRMLPSNSCCFIHVTLLPYIDAASELKTKPTQHSVKTLRSIGIQPDVIVCRSRQNIPDSAKDKIALFCNVRPDCVIQNIDADSLYDVPLLMEKERFADIVCGVLDLGIRKPDLSDWEKFVHEVKNPDQSIEVAIVGKYVSLKDAYLSCMEALFHAGALAKTKVNIHWVDSEHLNENNYAEVLSPYDGILAPGGYGSKGTEGIILAAKYARERSVPFLAIGFGMQLAVVEAVRNLLGMPDANSMEVNAECGTPVVRIPESRVCENDSRGAARSGSKQIQIIHPTLEQIYQNNTVYERHCNRYEVINDYNDSLREKGFLLAAIAAENAYPECYIYKTHPYFVACIYHCEFVSRPNRPHPLFSAFLYAILNKQ